jgi:hypothetical protein
MHMQRLLLVGMLLGSSLGQAQEIAAPRVLRQPIKPVEDPRSELLKVADARFGPDSLIYVGELVHNDIRVFDSRGRLVQNIGRGGAGPGEFRRIRDFGWVADTLWVVDNVLARVTFFAPKGRLLRVVPFPPEAGEGQRSVGDVVTLAGRVRQRAPVPFSTNAAPLILSLLDGRVIDTLAKLTIDRYLTPVKTERQRMSLIEPFMDFPIWDVDSQGRWLAVVERSAPHSSGPTHVAVQVRDLSRGTSRAASFAYTPVRLSKAIADSTLDQYAEMAGHDPATLAVIRDALYWPSFLPPVRAVIVNDSGGVWLERREGLDSRKWVYVDPRGRVGDVITIPAGYHVRDARGRSLLAVLAEVDDIQAPVVIYTAVK